MADALFFFISSIPAFKDGLLISSASLQQHALLRISNFRMKKCPGFLKTDALEVAKRAELNTVDANQTVFSQGSEPPDFSLYPARLVHCASFAESILMLCNRIFI